MRHRIVWTEVRFGLHDPVAHHSAVRLVPDDGAEQVTGRRWRGAVI
jgi:hypothetical protein